MAAPASKRRKTEHVSSEDDSENVSSTSLADEHEVDDVDSELDADLANEEQVESRDGDDDEDEDVESDSSGANEQSQQAAHHSKRLDDRRRPTKSSGALGAGNTAYARGTFKSNVFKLQVDELLTHIRPKHGKREQAAEVALHALKSAIEQIPAKAPSLLAEAEHHLIRQKVAVPFPEPRPPQDAKYKFAYVKPALINVVGSFALKTACRSRDLLSIDMVVCMPGTIFEEKDYLNHRYFYKRAYYLACIAAGLKSSLGSEYSLQFESLHDNQLKPILTVEPRRQTGIDSGHSTGSRWRINILPCTGEAQFDADKLRPERNCIRNSSGDGTAKQEPTPFYNSSLRSDMLMTTYLKLINTASKSCEAFKDACLLGSTWLRQRGFGSSMHSGGFGNFTWVALMALCLQCEGPNGNPLLSPGYSSYQLFKAILQLIATKDLIKQPLSFGEGLGKSESLSRSPTVWDAARAHNLLFEVQEWSYRMLQHEAKSTLNCLGDILHDGFDATFILRSCEPLYRYDCVVTIPQKLFESTNVDATTFEHLRKLYVVLKRGLGDRVRQINIIRSPSSAWQLGASRPKEISRGSVQVGLMIHPDHAKRTVDHGPSAEKKADAASFREFWGEKAELRRFKDGSILESLVWSAPQGTGQSVVEQIVRYLLKHHFGLDGEEQVAFLGDSMAKLVRGGSERTVFDHVMERYKEFETDIRSLHDLPLSIRQLMPADPQLRFASSKPPDAARSSNRMAPVHVVLQFEGSGRWPDDLVAIQRTKIAFLLKLEELLIDAANAVTTRVCLENEGREVLNQGYLDVTYDARTTFRLRIYHDREQHLHERTVKDKSADPKSREISAHGLAKYKRDFLKGPAHTQAVSRLCVRHPALSGSIRLMKRWFASHLLTNHVSDEVIELLVIRTFVQPWPWQTPCSVQTGFLRSLLWISRWDWRAEPLIVDLSSSGELKQADMDAVNTTFAAWRKLDPSLNRVACFFASNLDRDGVTWTDGRPAKVVAGRMTALAKAACAEVAEKQLLLEPENLFSSPLEDFDFVLHLSAVGLGARARKAGCASFKNLELESITDATLVGYQPLSDFLHELEELYGSSILFFYGGGERMVIGCLWSPSTARRAWKVNLSYSTIPTPLTAEVDIQADLNRSAVMAEIARVGGDLVDRVEVFQKAA